MGKNGKIDISWESFRKIQFGVPRKVILFSRKFHENVVPIVTGNIRKLKLEYFIEREAPCELHHSHPTGW